jgi:hypothetical protein
MPLILSPFSNLLLFIIKSKSGYAYSVLRFASVPNADLIYWKFFIPHTLISQVIVPNHSAPVLCFIKKINEKRMTCDD